MDTDIITLGDIETGKRKFHNSKYPVNIENLDIDTIINKNIQ